MMDGAPSPYKMREPCRGCGHEFGKVTETGAQDVVRCSDCNRFCYNAPRTETGKKVRTVQTVHEAIKPKLRARVIAGANGRCQLCGKGPESGATMHVAHMVSVKQGLENGMTDAEMNSEANLICACDECNLGLGEETIPLRLALAMIMAKTRVKP
jgi:5-methylcytosine-specific restriction endonuclease McrA